MKIKFKIIGLSIITFFSTQLMAESIYDFKVKTADQKEISLSDYKGKTLLIVNVASRCGFTSQYEGLETLYKKHKDKNFVILGFPSNQFMGQEPGTDAEIQKFCKLKYDVTFPVFAKVDVKGDSAIPLYKWLVQQKNAEGSISWNFNKFLINTKGEMTKYYGSKIKPLDIEADILKSISSK